MAWFYTNGPIPEGLEVCHKCDNPPCCNPADLFLGTHADNMRDAWGKGRLTLLPRMPGEANPAAKLTAAAVAEIRRRLTIGGITGAALGREYGVSKTLICDIKNGKNWKAV
jgi:hypothetical protein